MLAYIAIFAGGILIGIALADYLALKGLMSLPRQQL